MKISICDDDRQICEQLTAAIRRKFPSVKIETYLSGRELLFGSVKVSPDILLLDIRMPDEDGMAIARNLRDGGWDGVLIFVTGEEGRVFDAFDVRAFQFLVKPVSDERLFEVLCGAISEVERKRAFRSGGVRTGANGVRFIDVQTGGTHIRISLADILYAEVYDRKTIIHTLRDEIEYYGQLSDLANALGSAFFRVHRSYLIHFRYLERYNRETIRLTNGAEIPLSRRKYNDFVKAYLEYGKWMTSRAIGK